jgi:hypothetical protein
MINLEGLNFVGKQLVLCPRETGYGSCRSEASGVSEVVCIGTHFIVEIRPGLKEASPVNRSRGLLVNASSVWQYGNRLY